MQDARVMAKDKKTKSNMLTKNVTIAQNRRAKFDYELLNEYEAGIALFGTEVKSLRLGQASINESYVKEQNGEIFILNANIQEYSQAGQYFQHEPRQSQKTTSSS